MREIEQPAVIKAIDRNAVQQHQVVFGIAAAHEQIGHRSAPAVLCEDHARQFAQHIQRLRFIAFANFGAGDDANAPCPAGSVGTSMAEPVDAHRIRISAPVQPMIATAAATVAVWNPGAVTRSCNFLIAARC